MTYLPGRRALVLAIGRGLPPAAKAEFFAQVSHIDWLTVDWIGGVATLLS